MLPRISLSGKLNEPTTIGVLPDPSPLSEVAPVGSEVEHPESATIAPIAIAPARMRVVVPAVNISGPFRRRGLPSPHGAGVAARGRLCVCGGSVGLRRVG